MHFESVVDSNVIQPNITVPVTPTYIRVSNTLYTESAVPSIPAPLMRVIYDAARSADAAIGYMCGCAILGQVPLLIRWTSYTIRPPL